METRKVRIPARNLQTGMFVSRLDRPWLETPFLFQGFRIKSLKEVARLQELCEYVYVDLPADHPLARREYASSMDDSKPLVSKARQVVYETSTDIRQEIKVVAGIHERAGDLVRDIMEELRAGGELKLPSVERVVGLMVDSVVRNPDAFLWLSELKRRDSYTYHRALHSAVLAVALGRHIGLPKPDMHFLAMGCLLMDIGKTKIKEELLNKQERLTPEEFEVVKAHVQHGVQMLKSTPGVHKQIIFVVRTHHERHDGSGYPFGLSGLQIPLLGRIAGLVDCYGAITTDRPYAQAQPGTKALQSLYDWRNIDFQAELVEQLIQALGIYPTGTLVELSSGEVAAIVAQNRVRRLRPKVMLILDEEKRPYGHHPILDLIEQTEDKHGRPLRVLRGLDPGAYGIDASELYL